jgi:filamentous hemagglutinin family protein
MVDFKKELRRSTSLVGLCLLLSGLSITSAHANPSGGTVVGGAATITTVSPTQLDINQTSNNAIINWNTFNIASGETTQFIQPGASAVALNRVTNASQVSTIDGNLIANGRVILINQNGVIIGKTGNINTAGFIASSADIADSAFMNSTGTYDFNIAGNQNAAVTNQGSITVADEGLVALVAPTVSNQGIIKGNVAKISLAAGDTAGVDMYGDGLLYVAVSPTSKTKRNISATNAGSIVTSGGQVYMTAAAANSVVNSAINNTGVVEATSITNHNGDITLSAPGGTVTTAGTLNASGKAGGGTIALSGKYVTTSGSIKDLATVSGKGGSVGIIATDDATVGGKIDTSGVNGGGKVSLRAHKLNINSTAEVVADGVTSGQGGTIAVNGTDEMSIDGLVNANGVDGGGTVNIYGHDVAVSSTGVVFAAATQSGTGGTINIDAAHDDSIDGLLNANGVNGGGIITANGHNLAIGATGKVLADATIDGAGGSITLDSTHIASLYGLVDASGTSGGGTVGVSSRDISVGNTGQVNAEANTSGTGGTISFNSVNNTRIHGGVDADGIDNGGAIDITANSIYTDTDANMRAAGVSGGTIDLNADTLIGLQAGQFYTPAFDLNAPTLNITGNINLIANTDMNVNATTVNLGALIVDGANTPITDVTHFTSNAPAVNVLSDAAMVQQGVYLAGNGATVTVDSGTYDGAVTIDRPLTLQGDGSMPTLTASAAQPAIVTVAADGVTINGFNINGNGSTDGIILTGNNNTVIENNTIENSGTGLDASAYGNGNITLAGNTFMGNTQGADFGSGNLDLTGAANTFNGGNSALLFDTAMNGSTPANMTLVDNTLGTTILNGQTGVGTNKQYIDFENGAFFGPGDPTHINGYNVTYDGTLGSNLTASELTAAMGRIHDFNVDPTVGLVFPLSGGSNPITNHGTTQTAINENIATLTQIDPLGRPIVSVADRAIDYYPPFEPIETNGTYVDVNIKLPTQTSVALAGIEPSAGDEEGSSPMSIESMENIMPAAGGNGPGTTTGPTPISDITCANDFLANLPCGGLPR